MKKLLKDIKIGETIKVFDYSPHSTKINVANVTRITEKTIRADNNTLRVVNFRGFEELDWKDEYAYFFTTHKEARQEMIENKIKDIVRVEEMLKMEKAKLEEMKALQMEEVRNEKKS